MTTFEEQFPSLKIVRSNLGCRQGHINCVGNEEDDYVLVSNIQKHCLDKQRVREELLFRIKQHERNREIVAMLTGIIERLNL